MPVALVQYIYTSTCTAAMTPERAVVTSAKSVAICRELGLTGRVFANRRRALAITEGPTILVHKYYEAVRDDDMVETMMLQTERSVVRREFVDYRVGLNIGEAFIPSNGLFVLTRETMEQALPRKPSVRLRLMAEAYLGADMMAA